MSLSNVSHWVRKLKKDAEADSFALFREHLHRLGLPDEPELLLAGTIELVTTNTGRLETHAIRYQGGNRYPHLERIEGTPDYLDEILKPLTPVSAH